MAHLKTQMDLLTKHLLSGKIEKVKAMRSQDNQGGFQGNMHGNQGQNFYDKPGYKDREKGNQMNNNDKSGLYVPPENCEAASTSSKKMSMEEMMLSF